jgi:hypothetical protein
LLACWLAGLLPAAAAAILQQTKAEFPNLIFKTTNHDHTPCTNNNRQVIIPPSATPHLVTSDSMLSNAGMVGLANPSSSSSSSDIGSCSELQLMQEKFAPSCPAAGEGELAPACYAFLKPENLQLHT